MKNTRKTSPSYLSWSTLWREERKKTIICLSLFVVALLNFGISSVVYHAIGGDAVKGKQENGRYYVATGSEHTEVSRTVYTYSLYHTISMWLTHVVGIAAMLVLMCSRHNTKGSITNASTGDHLSDDPGDA